MVDPRVAGQLRWVRFALWILLASGSIVSCGYRVAQRNRIDLGISSVAVEPFENETTTYRVEQKLTEAMVRKFVEKTSWAVRSGPQKADAVLSGVVSRLSVSPVTFGQSSFGTTFLVTLDARVEFRENSTGRVLFKNDRYIFREQYQLNIDIERFFTEQNPALDRIADDFAASVVSSILEGF